MRLLLDQGLPRSAVDHLKYAGFAAVHVGTVGLSAAGDPEILEYARNNDFVAVTLAADFHSEMAPSGESRPSVIRVRVEGLKGKELAAFLLPVLRMCRPQLETGVLVTVDHLRARVRKLPLVK